MLHLERDGALVMTVSVLFGETLNSSPLSVKYQRVTVSEAIVKWGEAMRNSSRSPRTVSNSLEVLLRVEACAVCRTDLHVADGELAQCRYPVTPGHEWCGEIVEVGSAVAGLEPGLRVAGEGHVTCGHCRNCKGGRREFCHNHTGVGVTRPGAFAEFVVIPAENVFVHIMLPGDVTGDEVRASVTYSV